MQNKARLILAFIYVLLIISCKKQVEKAANNDTLVIKAKEYFSKTNTNSSLQAIVLNGKSVNINQIPRWDKARIIFEDSILVVPLEINYSGSKIGSEKYLKFIFNKNLVIESAYIYRFLNKTISETNKYEKADNLQLISDIFLGRQLKIKFSGLIQKYTLTDNLLSEYQYENGLPVKFSDKETVDDGPVLNVAPNECSSYIVDSYWLTYVNGVLIQIEYLYSTIITNCPTSGGGGGPAPTTNIVGTTNDSYAFTCPANFTFTSVTTNNLWQEAGISNASSNLVILDAQTGQTTIREMTVPKMYFGLPYYNINGGLVYTQHQAKQLSADAINYGEYKMRTYFKDHQNATTADLQQVWITEANNDLKNHTSGAGKVSKLPALNPTNPSVVNPYSGCY